MPTDGAAFAPALRSVGAGVICGFLAVVQSAGFGLLLLRGQSQFLSSTAIGMALFSTAVLALVAAFTSPTRGVVSIAQGIPIAAQAPAVAAVVVAAQSAANQNTDVVATVVIMLAASSILIGITCYAIGRFGLGRLIRFVPYPVIGGFLAGSGWLILMGGVAVIAGGTINPGSLSELVQPTELGRIGAVIGFLALVQVLRLKLPANLAVPIAAFIGIVIFNAAIVIFQVPAELLSKDHWLVTFAIEDTVLWPPVQPAKLGQADFGAMLAQAASLPVVIVLSVIAVLMNATGIELDQRRDIDFDRELRSVGLQNMLGGAGGGLPGFQSITLTTLANRLGASGVLTGVIVSAFCVAALVFGDEVLSLVPTPLLGGLLIWIGGQLLIEWLFRSYRRLTLGEYGVILLILGVIVGVDFATGIVVGMIAVAVLFIVEYGQVGIVRHVMTGRDLQSNMEAPRARRQVLRDCGQSILIIHLQGFLFFGTADRMRASIRDRIETAQPSIRYLVIDFRRVVGLDSSTAISFVRLAQFSEEENFTLVLCDLSPAVRAAIDRSGVGDGQTGRVRFENHFEEGLKWCEDRLLEEWAPGLIQNRPHGIEDLLLHVVETEENVQALLPHLERKTFEPGDFIVEQGARGDDILFIESGQAGVILEAPDHDVVRIATATAGSIIGEIAVYLDHRRSASVKAEEPVVAWRFTADDLETLHRDKPAVAAAFHRGMASLMADRLNATNRLLHLLVD